uniref:Uncharacterized protein n=1 Tax=Arundo donax TaxID=35708 RepID=A0A0A9C7Q7_ARUDO
MLTTITHSQTHTLQHHNTEISGNGSQSAKIWGQFYLLSPHHTLPAVQQVLPTLVLPC